MSNVTSLAALSVASLVALHNEALVEFGAPDGIAPLGTVKRKATAIEAIEALCAAGSLALNFDGDTATIVDASDAGGNGGDTIGDEGGDDTGTAGDDAPNADEGDDEGDEAQDAAPRFGDGKGKARAWGFVLGSDEWLAANPRGTAAREAYRKARRAAARGHRKLKRAVADAAAE